MTGEKQLWQMWDDMAFISLFDSFRLATGATKLMIALLAIAAIVCVGWFMDACCRTVVVKPDVTGIRSELDVYIESPARTDSFIKANAGKAPGRGVFSTLWHFGAGRFNNATMLLLRLDISNIFANVVNAFSNLWLCVISLVWAFRYHTFYSVIFFALVFVVFCIAGGAICRCASVEFARREKPGITEALRFSLLRLTSLVGGPLVPLGIMLCIASFIFLLGLAGNVPWAGEIIVGIGLAAAIIAGAIIAALAVGTITGANLMFPVIAYEGSNGLEAVSRSFHYVLSQPWWVIFYSFVAVIWGTISYLFVRFFTFLLLIITHTILAVGMSVCSGGADKLARLWPRPDFYNLMVAAGGSPDWSGSVAAFIVRIVVLMVVGLVIAFVISYYFCASTVIYSLMRKKVDNIPVDRVYVHLDSFELS